MLGKNKELHLHFFLTVPPPWMSEGQLACAWTEKSCKLYPKSANIYLQHVYNIPYKT